MTTIAPSGATFVYDQPDEKGKPVPFKPGKTWVLLAPQTSELTQN